MPKQNVPALRLDGFSGEWEEKTIQQISVPVSRVNPDSTAPIMMISAADGFINQSEKYSSDNAGKSLSKYVELHQGELAYNHGASKLRPFGSCFELRETAARVPFVYHCFRVVEEHPTFTSYSLNRKSVQSQLERLVSSGARMDGLLNISFPQYGTVTTHFPTFEEQQAIGAIFTNLDAAINQHTLKHKALQQSKTALMQRMFPQEGQTVPELRLEGFSGEWETVSLNELQKRCLVILGRGEVISQIDINARPGSYPIYSSSAKNRGLFGRYGRYMFSDERITWSIDGGGQFFYRPTHRYSVTNVCGWMKVNTDTIDTNFLYLALYLQWLDQSFDYTMKAHPSNIVQIYNPCFPPTLEEQQAIGAVFTNLDQLIAAEAQYIASLKQAKTALLQRMFI